MRLGIGEENGQVHYRTISNPMVAALKVGKDTVFWYRQFTGFGVRAYHTQFETTARYTHLTLDSVHKSAARIADSTPPTFWENLGDRSTDSAPTKQ